MEDSNSHTSKILRVNFGYVITKIPKYGKKKKRKKKNLLGIFVAPMSFSLVVVIGQIPPDFWG